MSLRKLLRGFRAPTIMLACAALAAMPAAADAKPAKKPAAKKAPVALKEAHGKKPAAGAVQAVGRTQSTAVVNAPVPNGLGTKLGLSAGTQLAAMTTAIQAAPAHFAGRDTRCKLVTPVLASQGGQVMAGNFRDQEGNCYVWLNMQQSAMLTGSEICKTTLHEMGHLSGLQHSPDPLDVMFAPFQADPIPAVCAAPAAVAKSKRR